jgi:hypothetical protein
VGRKNANLAFTFRFCIAILTGDTQRRKINLVILLVRTVATAFKDEAYLLYIRTQRAPRCKHSPLRL